MFIIIFDAKGSKKIYQLKKDGKLKILNVSDSGKVIYITAPNEYENKLKFTEYFEEVDLLPNNFGKTYIFTADTPHYSKKCGAYVLNRTKLILDNSPVKGKSGNQLSIEGDNWEDMKSLYAKFIAGSIRRSKKDQGLSAAQ